MTSGTRPSRRSSAESRPRRCADARLAAVRLAARALCPKERLRKTLVAPLFGSRAVGELGQGPRRGRGLERAEEVTELARCGAHAGISRSYRSRDRLIPA